MAVNKTLLIDIGNSSTLMACVDSNSLYGDFDTVVSKTIKTPTENLGAHSWIITSDQFDCIVCASVVPEKESLFRDHPNCTFVSHSNIPVLSVDIDYPETLGADRVVNALAAYTKYNQRCLVVDSGTATTFCMVSDHAVYEGGVIYPGMGIASKALELYTAKIPLIYVKPQIDIIGKSTEQAVQIGLFHGTIAMINGMISKYKETYPGLKVIGTGTALEIMKDTLDLDEFDPMLIIKGLLHILKTKSVSKSVSK
jgi:type III pantothenate kinase